MLTEAILSPCVSTSFRDTVVSGTRPAGNVMVTTSIYEIILAIRTEANYFMRVAFSYVKENFLKCGNYKLTAAASSFTHRVALLGFTYYIVRRIICIVGLCF
jgi:hypothetical protein